jgi:hypothetical protein
MAAIHQGLPRSAWHTEGLEGVTKDLSVWEAHTESRFLLRTVLQVTFCYYCHLGGRQMEAQRDAS